MDLNCPFCQAPLDPGAAGCRGCGSAFAGDPASAGEAPPPKTAAKPESKRLPPAGNDHSRALRAKLTAAALEQPKSRALHALGHMVRPGRVDFPWKDAPSDSVAGRAPRPAASAQRTARRPARSAKDDSPRPLLTRVLSRVPSWVVSGVVHAVMLVILALVTYTVAKAPPDIVFVKVEEPPPPTQQLPQLPELGNTDLVNDLDTEVPAPVIPSELLDNPETADDSSSTSVRTAEKLTVAPGASKYGWRGHGGRRYAAATGGGTWGSEQAVDRGLRWLAANQQDGGWWGYHEDIWTNQMPVSKSMRAGLTSLACLAFLGAGNLPERGKYRASVERGLDFLIAIQDDDGAIAEESRQHAYHHSMATLALCEAVAMGAGERYRAAADRAVKHLIWAQGEDGGWRYHPRSIRGDSSSSGWGLMALAAARAGNVRKAEAERALRRAHIFFETLTNADGQVLYVADSNMVPHDNALTAVGLLCKYLGGTPHSHPLMGKAASAVVEEMPRWPDPQLKGDKKRQAKEIFTKQNPINFYRWYYTSIGLIHRNDENWKAWNPRCRNLLVNMQRRGARAVDGSWDPLGVWCPSAGRVYSTALSVLTLEVYYRAAPSFLEAPEDELEKLSPLTPFYGQALIERAMEAVAEARKVMRTSSTRAPSAVATAEAALERFRAWAKSWLANPAPEASLEVKAWLRLATRAEGEMALGRGDRERALELLVPALIRDPDGTGAPELRRMVTKALLEQAKSAREGGDEAEAAGAEREAVRLIEDMLQRGEIEAGPKERRMRLVIADIHARSGMLDKAAEAYEGALRTAS
ncbi:MAG: hypothetical protein ACYTGX_01425, partial [Planctomycetota bacterium]